MNDKKLLTEFVNLEYNVNEVKENIAQNKPIFLRGIFQRSDEKNQNGRIYPRKILEREVENYTKMVKDNMAVGALDHPDSSVVELKHASHIVRELGWENNDVVGKLEVLNTPDGKIAQTLLEAGIKVGISSRGVGSLKEANGVNYVEEDFVLLSFDLVSSPSTFGAFLTQEAKDFNLNSLPKSYQLNRILNKILI